ncbi:peptidase inhibitor family I36 protein [Streptomyces sp. NPDC006645]|uniref:peptidase inhibitor family I36 protein n=1 Tax=unclassified Streptomyces TaxID=2593676 RepID=UPI0033BA7380
MYAIKKIVRATVLGTVAVSTAALGAFVPSAPAAAAPTAWGACAEGNVCFYTGFDGTGSKCTFPVADRDWTQAPLVCSWSQTTNVKSVWNNGTSPNFTGVAYYQWNNMVEKDRKGCTLQGKRGDLAGTYKLKSHQWVDGPCAGVGR